MAIDYNAVRFLLWAKNLGATFDRTVTLGHLGFSCSQGRLQRALREFDIRATQVQIDRCCKREPGKAPFAEEFLRLLGAKETISVDRSNFEGATFVHDLNEPFPDQMSGAFNLVLDGGTLEHVFDFPRALRHCMGLVATRGHIVLTTPANQFMGHGFYQFSPELFFRVFCPDNGFALRKIVAYDGSRLDAVFYRVMDPAVVGARVEINSSPPVLLAVLAQRTALVPILRQQPQQSDYFSAWNRSMAERESSPTSLGRLREALSPYWPFWLRWWKNKLVARMREGRRTLTANRAFRRLTREEIVSERSGHGASEAIRGGGVNAG